MAKSMRSKKIKRLRAVRREMVEPLYETKDAAKLAAQDAALAAPKLPVRRSNSVTTTTTTSMDTAPSLTASGMDIEMAENQNTGNLKPVGGVGKKLKKKFKLAKRKKRGGNGKVRKTHI